MPKRSPNALIRQRYEQARSVVKRDEQRTLSQQEFLDVAFGTNPRTDKPYNPRTLRKWLRGERDATQAVVSAKQRTYSFQQRVTIDDHDYAPTLTKPSGASGLDLWTPTGRKRVNKATRTRLQQIITQRDLADKPIVTDGPKDLTDTDRYLRSVRGMRNKKARAVSKKRAGTIITRRQRGPIGEPLAQAA